MEDSADYKIMTEYMGGELAQVIRDTKNLKFRCDEDEIHECVNWRSWDHKTEGHPMGFSDVMGKKWWIYIYCEKEKY